MEPQTWTPERFQELIDDANALAAAVYSTRRGFEVWPRGAAGVDFPPAIQEYLTACGFVRLVNRRWGPFYRRPWPAQEGVNDETAG